MIHVFALLVWLGDNLQKDTMYFYDIDRCKYFAERINRQPPTPKGSYVAVCEVKEVEKNSNIYY